MSTREMASHPFEEASRRQLCVREDFTAYLKNYSRERPLVVALWCLGLGFLLGWKLKPW